MKFTMDSRPSHEDLCMAFNVLVARTTRDAMISHGIAEGDAIKFAEIAAFSIAVMFDQSRITVNDEAFTLKLSFTDGEQNPVPVEGVFDLHDYAASVLEFDDYD